MIFWLDHRIFGNGYGLATPYFDGRFYWLSRRLYTFSPGFGAQLQSIQWRHPKPGEERTIGKRKFRPFNSTRYFLWLWRDGLLPIPTPICRVRVSWACALPRDLNEANAELREIEAELGRL